MIWALVQSAGAYVLEGQRWPSGSVVTFQLSLGPPGRTLTDGNTSWNIAAAPAPDAWDNVMANLVFEAVAQSATAVSGDGQNTIQFASTNFGDSFGNRTLAVTTYLSSGSTMQEADILFNNHLTWDSYRGVLRYDGTGNAIPEIRRVLIHEMGHALGLDHPDDHGQHVDAIMNSIISNRETLSADDIAGAQALYGAPTPVTSVSTTPIDDFNGDGSPDLVLYNANSRQTAIWYLSNNAFVSGVFAPSLPAGWKVVGVADFNRDGQDDFLLVNSTTNQTAIWYLSGFQFVSAAYGPTIARGYTLVAVADFNRDGKPDFLFYNPSSGQTAIWYLNNNAFAGAAYGPTLPADWRIAGIADFNGDHQLDYLLCNTKTRQCAVWYLSGPTFQSAAYMPTAAAGYVLKGAADFDGDGSPDYFLYSPTSRQTLIWYLSNNEAVGSASGPSLPTSWSPAGP